MEPSQRHSPSATQEFGISDIEYDLVTTLSNLLEGMDVLQTYAADAASSGQHEIAGIFHSIRSNNGAAALQVRGALAKLITAS